MDKHCIFLEALSGLNECFRKDAELARRVDIANQYDLSEELLSGTTALILTMAQDQRHMLRNGKLLNDYVREGGTIVVQGQVAFPFLDCLAPYEPAENLSFGDFEISFDRPHPVFHGIDSSTLNLRRGVRGFYAHGSNPPPHDAQVISSLCGGTIPVDWQWESGRGRVFVHSGNDVWLTFANRDKDILLTRNLVAWAMGKVSLDE